MDPHLSPRSHCLSTGFMPDVFHTSELGVVSSHFRRCLPFADICFDTQPLLSPDILLKMLEPGILFRTLNLNQSHPDLSSDRNDPDLRQHVPFPETPDWRLAARLRLSGWPLIFILHHSVASSTLTQTQWLSPWPWCQRHLIALWPRGPFLPSPYWFSPFYAWTESLIWLWLCLGPVH